MATPASLYGYTNVMSSNPDYIQNPIQENVNANNKNISNVATLTANDISGATITATNDVVSTLYKATYDPSASAVGVIELYSGDSSDATKLRWAISAKGLESGGNAGSDLNIVAFDDTGVVLSTPIAVTRAGAISVSGTLSTSDVDVQGNTVSDVQALSLSAPSPAPANCTLNIACNNATNQSYTIFGPNGGSAGLTDGYLSYYSYNTSSTPTQGYMFVAPQTNSTDCIVQFPFNVEINNLTATSINCPKSFSTWGATVGPTVFNATGYNYATISATQLSGLSGTYMFQFTATLTVTDYPNGRLWVELYDDTSAIVAGRFEIGCPVPGAVLSQPYALNCLIMANLNNVHNYSMNLLSDTNYATPNVSIARGDISYVAI